MKNRNLVLSVAIIIIAAILRLYFVFIYPQVQIAGDALVYDELGWNLAQGKGFVSKLGFPEIVCTPGYPFFLSIVYKAFGHSYASVKFFQILLSLISMIIIYLLAKSIFSQKIAIIALSISAFYPPFLSYNALILTESLFTFFLVFYIYLLSIVMQKNSWKITFLTGAVGGCAIFIKEEFILLILGILLLAFLYFKEKFKHVLIIVLISLGVLAPWLVRNYNIFNKSILISALSGKTFWISTYKEEWLEWKNDNEYLNSLTRGLSVVQQNEVLLKEGLRNIKEAPFLYAKFCLKRFLRLWVGSHSNTFYGLTGSFQHYFDLKDYIRLGIKSFLLILNTSLVILGFIGFWVSVRLRPQKLPILIIGLPVFITTVVHFFLFSTTRYQVPVMPFMIIFAASII
ncbi:MAG: glycosyltransferase family 39 protein, partial [Candidatus Omnitrophica bacterium]|nr:glycosyltransferase family 39 protein [Candidatus Omnitrophota bacterium]